jgi:hypothetical protein
MTFKPYVMGAFAAIAGIAAGAAMRSSEIADLQAENQKLRQAAEISQTAVNAGTEIVLLAQEFMKRADAFCPKRDNNPWTISSGRDVFITVYSYPGSFDFYEGTVGKTIAFLEDLKNRNVTILTGSDPDITAYLSIMEDGHPVLKLTGYLAPDEKEALQVFVKEMANTLKPGQSAILYEPIRNEGYKSVVMEPGETSFVENRTRITVNTQLCPP